jgi:hypothetical protein
MPLFKRWGCKISEDAELYRQLRIGVECITDGLSKGHFKGEPSHVGC